LWGLAGTSRGSKKFLELISGSLHAVYVIPGQHGLVQLMPDLSHEGFALLRPKDLGSGSSLRKMCRAFIGLVVNTLIPLALEGVVHADLRPGFDRTANIMYNKRAGTMRLIDMDSLLLFINWGPALTKEDKRILSKANGDASALISTPLMFVLMQTVCVATAWLQGKLDRTKVQQNVNTDEIIESYLHDKDLPALEDELKQNPYEVTVQALKKILDGLPTQGRPL
jgi:hypothetical protein